MPKDPLDLGRDGPLRKWLKLSILIAVNRSILLPAAIVVLSLSLLKVGHDVCKAISNDLCDTLCYLTGDGQMYLQNKNLYKKYMAQHTKEIEEYDAHKKP